MKVRKSKSAWLLVAGAIFALSVTVLNSCSSDDDYDMYMGDELRTHAAATRSASAESGTAIYQGSYVYAAHTTIFDVNTSGGWTFSVGLEWTSGYTGNLTQPRSNISFTKCAPASGDDEVSETGPVNGMIRNYKKRFIDSSVSWEKNDVISMKLKSLIIINGNAIETKYDVITMTFSELSAYISHDEIEDNVNGGDSTLISQICYDE